MPNESIAHLRSASAIIDPVYDSQQLMPQPEVRSDTAPWLYGAGEFECQRLRELRLRVKEAELNVGYPGEFHLPAERAWFRHRLTKGTELVLRTSGKVAVSAAGKVIAAGETGCRCRVPSEIVGESFLLLEVSAPGDLPGILVEQGEYCTADGMWEWSGDGVHWEGPATFGQPRNGVPPHRAELEEILLYPVAAQGNLHDFGREIFGKIVVHGTGKPEICAGESCEEAQNRNPGNREQSMELAAVADGVWESRHSLAFRYVRLTGPGKPELSCRAQFHPVRYRGAFACSDRQLTRIWGNSAYTLRLCMQDFLLDGIKRDRLPWAGDLTMSLMVNAYTFGEAEIVRRSLTVLGRAGIGHCHLNGIIDYSLWWIISHDCFQLYYGDIGYLRREWPRIDAHLKELLARCDDNGMLTVSDGDWLFIDWVEGDKMTALQILWYWALRSAVRLAERLHAAEPAECWRRHADILASFLQRNAWDERRQIWMGIPAEPASFPSRHAQFFSVLSGLARPGQKHAILKHLLGDRLPPVGTPYMAGFENMALCSLGAAAEMLARVGEYWGGMLKRGATTFWEAYSPEEQEAAAYAFYGRAFGKSLCHAWSAGPAAFLPAGLFSLRPLEDGWKRFAIAPAQVPLDWIAATVPTPAGEIEILQEAGSLLLRLPPGTAAEWNGKEFRGKAVIELEAHS